MYLIYSMLLGLVLVLGSPYWLFEILCRGKYRRGFAQRLGLVPKRFLSFQQPTIWVHAVSVGEVMAVSGLVAALRGEFPESRLLVSTTTDSGQKLAATRFGPDNVFYFPLDFKFAMTRWLQALRPRLVIIAETELWPNFLRSARQVHAPVVIVNARISDRSFSGYRKARTVLSHVLEPVQLFLAQTPEDGRRLIEIGARPERVMVGGNLKYDVAAPASPAIADHLRSVLRASGARPVLVFGSTVEGEEPIVIDAFKKVLAEYPAAIMILAPRHPERFSSVARLLQESGIQFWRRSEWSDAPVAGGIWLLDSIGELSGLYQLADVAFVGGSLVASGGHNILEPARYGVPILVGEHTENFRDMVARFDSQNALRVVRKEELGGAIYELLQDDEGRKTLGRRALEILESERGATDTAVEQIRTLLAGSRREVPA
jgi:3-deoxy-D-manno-octulosonic-acid transferase